jgi:hypothetical protein
VRSSRHKIPSSFRVQVANSLDHLNRPAKSSQGDLSCPPRHNHKANKENRIEQTLVLVVSDWFFL